MDVIAIVKPSLFHGQMVDPEARSLLLLHDSCFLMHTLLARMGTVLLCAF